MHCEVAILPFQRVAQSSLLPDNRDMRKTVIRSKGSGSNPSAPASWLDLPEIARAEVTSEDSDFPIEDALVPGKGRGWRAGEPGDQIIRLVFDSPRALRRIRLEFSEAEVDRTQQLTLRYSETNGPFKEIVRQQWNFSPQGSNTEVEDYEVEIDNVTSLELQIRPDLSQQSIFATLDALRVA